MTATIHNFMDKLINDDGFSKNEKEILKFVTSANCAIKAAKQWPEDRKAHLEYCRHNVVKALVFLDEELEDERDS